MQEIHVYLEDQEYIALCDLLKLTGLTDSGGRAKQLIAQGLVSRNGVAETRKTAKIRHGDTVHYQNTRIEVLEGYDDEHRD